MQGNPGFFVDDYWKPKKFKSIKKCDKFMPFLVLNEFDKIIKIEFDVEI